MKAEDEPVTDDEFVLRLIWCDYFKQGLPLPVQPAAFQPRESETEGISVFRQACLDRAESVLAVIAEAKRNRYYIARLPVSELLRLGLTVQPAAIAAVPGHAIVPELNARDYRSKRVQLKEFQIELAHLASNGIVHRPTR